MSEFGILLHFDTDIAEPLLIETDPVQLHLVLIFLCSNARDSLQKTGGNVTLRLKKTGGEIEIFVEDDGAGIAEDVQKLMFCPYYSGRQAGRGLGFGLSKAWRIMEQLGGSLCYEIPENGRGAGFVVRLPF
jgi:C4-dicarboxylate-specific signal transduction histidine kinase